MSMTRRTAMTVGAPALLLGQAAARKPNVILIMTDDQGYGDFSCHGNDALRTPRLDTLRNESTRMDRFYVSPVCAPTRSSLLTGRYNLRCGVWGVTGGRETMRRDETTMAEAFRPAGYRTGLIGKWHLGEHYPYVPHAQGFDEFIGMRLGHWNHYFDPQLERNGVAFQGKGYITDILTEEAMGFVDRNRRDPFFLYLAYNAPHSPWIVPDADYDRHKGLAPETASVYGMVENVDWNIGRLMDHLANRGLAENTIVAFLCDNGGVMQPGRFNAGLRAGKASVYEGGVRSPLWIRWPGKLQPRDVKQIGAHIDLYPTLTELCGVKRPDSLPIDGKSLAPLLRGENVSWPDRRIFHHRETGRDPKDLWAGSVRTQQWSLVQGQELYDLGRDPGEKNDLAKERPEVVRGLRGEYEKWAVEAIEQCRFEVPPVPVGYAEENPVVMQATQAKLAGGVKYFADSGFAHDWITNWSNPAATATWEIDAVRGGRYELGLRYRAAAAGAKVTVQVGGKELQTEIAKATPGDPVPTGNRVARKGYQEWVWGTQSAGVAELPAGRTRVVVSGGGMDLKSVVMKRS